MKGSTTYDLRLKRKKRNLVKFFAVCTLKRLRRSLKYDKIAKDFGRSSGKNGYERFVIWR